MKIGNVTVEPPVVVAPMAGTTCMPFRLLCRRAGAGLVCSEMVSANAIAHGSRKTDELLVMCEGERPVSVQVFGAEPELVAGAARRAEAEGADIVDINMGCPVRKVVRAGAGAALLADPGRAVAVAEAVVRAVDVPVTAKIRAGRRQGDHSYIQLAAGMAAAGVAAVTVHARTASQGYRGPADWSAIARTVESASVPIIGNGDVGTPDDATRMMAETGCAAVMVGRAALGNPFIFRQIADRLRGGSPRQIPIAWRMAAALWHAQALVLHYGERIGVRRMRQQACWYSRGMPGAASFRQQACLASTLGDLTRAIMELHTAAQQRANIISPQAWAGARG
jgi:tRNA-dihydrouridine synthase B